MPEEITPAVQFARDLAEAQSQLSTLQQKSHLSSARDSLEDLDTKIGTLSARIIELRSRKYAFDKDLAEQATQIVDRWKTLQPSIVNFIERQEAQMQIAIRPLESQISYVAIQRATRKMGW
jgi:predicted  nucleic acid-binding Zn-ribbon protein